MTKSSAITASFSVTIIVLLSFIQSYAQSPTTLPAIKGKRAPQIEKVIRKPGEIVERITFRDGSSENITVDLGEQLSLIIEMTDEPLFLQQLHSTAGGLRKISDPRVHLSQFKSDLSSLYQSDELPD